jgi:glycosyltransferase involved in cell wall biosynthesis
MNTFSILIVNYNYEAHVARAILSSLSQQYPADSFEVIIVDDGSTDNSAKVIDQLVHKHDQLHFIKQSNIGQAAAFYAGLARAKFEWVCLLDSDDYFNPDKLSVLNDFIDQCGDHSDFICHNVDAFDVRKNEHHDWFAFQKVSGEALSVNDAFGAYPFANPCGQVYKKSLLNKISPWVNLAEWKRGADNPLVWGALFLNGRVCYLHQTLAVYCIHDNNHFLSAASGSLSPKINWIERWPKLLAFLEYFNQGVASSYASTEDRDALLERLQQYYTFWAKRLSTQSLNRKLTFITSCKNRLHHLKQTLPRMVKQSNAEVIVVDYGCTQGTTDWVQANFPQVKIVRVDDDMGWSAARARNLGAAKATTEWLCFIDADIILKADLGLWVSHHACDGFLYQADPMPSPDAKGTAICQRDAYLKVGGYDEAYRGWFPEDGDFYDSLVDIGIKRAGFSANFLVPIAHGDEERALGNPEEMASREQSMRTALVYRMAKKDIVRLTGKVLALEVRKNLLQNIMAQVKKFHASAQLQDGQITLSLNQGMTPVQSFNLDRRIVYAYRNTYHIFDERHANLLRKRQSSNSANQQKALRVAMFHIGRTGSSVLADMLKQHPAMGWVGEIYETQMKAIQERLGFFNFKDVQCQFDPVNLLKQTIDFIGDTSFGFEVKFNHLEHCGITTSDYLKAVKQLGVNKLIVLRRHNFFRKIVSSLVAGESGKWHIAMGQKTVRKKITINPDQLTINRKTGTLKSLLDGYAQSLSDMDALLINEEVLQLNYEDDIEHDPLVGYNKIAAYLGLSAFSPTVRLTKTNPFDLSEIVENLDELRVYLKDTEYAWMLYDKNYLAQSPIIKTIANPAPNLLLDRAMTLGDDFIKFSAMAHVFDIDAGKKELRRLEKIKDDFAKRHPNWVGEMTLAQSVSAATSILASTFEGQDYRQTNNWLGVSSGYDSRFLLHGLRKSSVDFNTFSFGEPGYADFDLPKLISERLSLNTLQVDLGKLAWSLDFFDQTISLVNDKPIHAREKVANYLLTKNPSSQITIIHGHPNNPLIGMMACDSQDDAKNDFVRINDQFKWHTFFDKKWLHAQIPDDFMRQDVGLSYIDQLLLGLRAQRGTPQDSDSIKYLMPYAQDDWMAFWLHRSEEERMSHDLFLRMVTHLNAEEFFDFNLLSERRQPLNKNEQMRLIYGKSGLISARSRKTSIDPFAQICFYSLCRNSQSFKKVIDQSLLRLRKRNVFQPSAIDYIVKKFMAADPAGEKMMRGLITCDVALESGIFAK